MDLTSIARVKQYLAGNTANAAYDPTVSQLISRASDQVIRYCSRNFQRNSYTSTRLNGTGTAVMRLPDYPVISVSAVALGLTDLVESADGIAAGYQFDEFRLYLFGGYLFPMGKRNVVVSYVAGYTTTDTDFIPAANGPYMLTPSEGGYAFNDRGVANATTGAAFTLVGSTPAAGQYSFSGGIYTFNAADTGKQVTMSYDYVPGAVEQAVIEIVGTTLKQRDNLGINSKTLRDETISYADKDLSASVKGLLAPYRKIIPI